MKQRALTQSVNASNSTIRNEFQILPTMRDVIDYSLDKRSTLVALFRGDPMAADACDAHPYLLRAAKYHGETTDRKCPVCRKTGLTELRYAYGDQLGQYSGRIKNIFELKEMQSEFGEFRVYQVEICQDCGWNHLIKSFSLGDGKARKPPRKVKTIEDES